MVLVLHCWCRTIRTDLLALCDCCCTGTALERYWYWDIGTVLLLPTGIALNMCRNCTGTVLYSYYCYYCAGAVLEMYKGTGIVLVLF